MPGLFSFFKELILNKTLAKTYIPRNCHTQPSSCCTPENLSDSLCNSKMSASVGMTETTQAPGTDIAKGSTTYPSVSTPPPGLDDSLTISIIESLGKASDLVTRTLMAGPYQVSMLYIDGMIDSSLVSECIIRPLADNIWVRNAVSPQDLVDRMDWGGIYAVQQKKQTNKDDIISDILTGSVALIFNELATALTFDCKGFDKRSVGEPTEEHTLKGPKDCFVETMRTNTATIRRKICSPDLAIDNYILGQDTNTMAALVYQRGRVKEELITSIKKRLDEAKIEDMLSLSGIENLLLGNSLSPFPQILYTEKPDRFCAGILDGRVGLIVDGIPFVMILPYSFFDFFRIPADYNYKYLPSMFYRLMRYVLFFITLFLPGLFVALCSFHPEMMPTDLAISLAKSRQGVPLPAFFEMTLVLIAFHALIQASLGSWTSLGGTVSIVGALVLGDAAINARFISPSILVVVAVTGICTISLQNFELLFATVIWQFIILFASNLYGLLGTLFAGLLLLYCLSRLETLGIPYLQPFESYTKADKGWFPPSLEEWAVKLRTQPINPLRLKPKAPKR